MWERTVFCANRDRLLEKDLLREFFDRVLMIADSAGLISDEHFSVDGTMIDAWASHKSFVRKDRTDKGDDDAGGGRNRTVDFQGEKRSNQTLQPTIDQDARVYRKSPDSAPNPCYLNLALMENRSGLVVDVETTQATGTAEREAAKKMAARTIRRPGATLGADKGYDASEFVQTLHAMNITPHIAAKKRGSAMEEHTTQRVDYRISLRLRKRIEEIFGWAKTVGGFRKTRFIGTDKVHAQALLIFAA